MCILAAALKPRSDFKRWMASEKWQDDIISMLKCISFAGDRNQW